jgi:signal transduction histidine kinase
MAGGGGKTPIKFSIGTKLILTFVGLTLFVVAVTGYLVYGSIRSSLEDELGRKLMAVARIAETTIPLDMTLSLQRRSLDSGSDEELPRVSRSNREKLRDLALAAEVSRIYLFDPDGRSLADSYLGTPLGMSYPGLEFFRHEIREVLAGQPTKSTLFRGPGGGHFITCFLPVVADGQVKAVVCAEASATFLAELDRLGNRILVTGLLGILLTAVAALLLSRGIVTPINRLVDAAEGIGKGNLKSPIEVTSSDEVGFLARTMETMRRKINRRDEEMMTMLAGVAHEIRNPLGGIEIFAGLLSEGLAQQPEEAELVGKINHEVQNLKLILGQFIEFAYPLKTRKETCRVEDLVGEVLPSVEQKIASNEIKLVVGGDDSATIHADREQMKRALENLTLNAVQAMPEGGDLRISWRRNARNIIVSISDTGPGVPLSDQEKIYDPFFTTKKQGCGLGLAVTRKIIAENHGRIDLHSETGKGATFDLLFPMIRGKVKTGETKQ